MSECQAPENAVIWAELKALRREIEINKLADQRALDLQSSVYEHRLAVLNHAHEEQEKRNQEYVPRETYEAEHEAFNLRLTAITKLVYIGVGIVLALQAVITAVIFITRK